MQSSFIQVLVLVDLKNKMKAHMEIGGICFVSYECMNIS